jgi:thymidine kinase
LFGLPAVPAPEKTSKRARNKGGAVPSEDIRAPEPDTSESQDVEMAESQITEDLASGTTEVDSQQESQATEIVTQVEVSFFLVLRLKIIQATNREETVPSPLTGLKRRPRRDRIFRTIYLLAEADCLYCFNALCKETQHPCYACILRSRLTLVEYLFPFVGYKRVYVQLL